MTTDPEIAAAQIWISHLCHELVSPVGAINNGVELIEETGIEGVHKEALELIAESGRMAAAKLRFYRVAYGRAGSAGDIGLAEARAMAVDLLAGDGRTTIDWPVLPQVRLVPGAVQLLLNLLLLSAGCLPRGGAVSVDLQPGDIVKVTITARGVNARVAEDIVDAVVGKNAEMDHRTSHGVLCAKLAAQIGQKLSVAGEEGAVAVSVGLPVDRS